MNKIPPEAIHVSTPRDPKDLSINWHRLRTYIQQRVAESYRTSQNTKSDGVNRAHGHSVMVGKDILDELQAAGVFDKLDT